MASINLVSISAKLMRSACPGFISIAVGTLAVSVAPVAAVADGAAGGGVVETAGGGGAFLVGAGGAVGVFAGGGGGADFAIFSAFFGAGFIAIGFFTAVVFIAAILAAGALAIGFFMAADLTDAFGAEGIDFLVIDWPAPGRFSFTLVLGARCNVDFGANFGGTINPLRAVPNAP